MKVVVAIYNKLDDDSPYRSDIFDLFGSQDGSQRGIVGTKKGAEFRALEWAWGQNGIKKVCKFLYWRLHRRLGGFDAWYRGVQAADFRPLGRLIDSLLYVFKYRGRAISAFIASVDGVEKRGKHIWFRFTPRKFVLLPPDFMEDYRRHFFDGGRESAAKWAEYCGERGYLSGYSDELGDIWQSGMTQDVYHIVPVDFVEEWVQMRAEPKFDTRPIFVATIQDDKLLAGKGLPTNNEIFWSVFSQYIGRSQVKGKFYVVERGQEYAVTDIPVNSLTERGLVYYQEVGAAYAIFRALIDAAGKLALDGATTNRLLDVEFRDKHRCSIRLAESSLLARAERVADAVGTYDSEYERTDYDYVLRLSGLGGKHSLLFDLTSGLWRKGAGNSKEEFVAQWTHNLFSVPLRNENVISVWHYGLTEYEPYQGKEVGRHIIDRVGLSRDKYLYIDKSTPVRLPSDLRVVMMPFYDNDGRYNSLSEELRRLDPNPTNTRANQSQLYGVLRNLAESLLQPKPVVVSLPAPRIRIYSEREATLAGGKYRTLLPLYSYRAAAGYFRRGEKVEREGWVRVPKRKAIDKSLFVVRVAGHSMEPKIKDGDYCIFTARIGGSRKGEVVLVELDDFTDPDDGGALTVKLYTSEKDEGPGDTEWRHLAVVLRPYNREYEPIVLTPDQAESMTIVGVYKRETL
jgi:SOS-response transcriptional repressor LexA